MAIDAEYVRERFGRSLPDDVVDLCVRTVNEGDQEALDEGRDVIYKETRKALDTLSDMPRLSRVMSKDEVADTVADTLLPFMTVFASLANMTGHDRGYSKGLIAGMLYGLSEDNGNGSATGSPGMTMGT